MFCYTIQFIRFCLEDYRGDNSFFGYYWAIFLLDIIKKTSQNI